MIFVLIVYLPDRYWNGSSTGQFRNSVWTLNVQSESSVVNNRAPALMFGNVVLADRPCANLGKIPSVTVTNKPILI
jgi:hypothetical protein